MSAAVHLPVNLRCAHVALYGHGNAKTDSPVIGSSVDVGLEGAGHGHRNASVASMDIPGVFKFCAGVSAGGNASVASLPVERVKTADKIHRPVDSSGFQ